MIATHLEMFDFGDVHMTETTFGLLAFLVGVVGTLVLVFGKDLGPGFRAGLVTILVLGLFGLLTLFLLQSPPQKSGDAIADGRGRNPQAPSPPQVAPEAERPADDPEPPDQRNKKPLPGSSSRDNSPSFGNVGGDVITGNGSRIEKNVDQSTHNYFGDGGIGSTAKTHGDKEVGRPAVPDFRTPSSELKVRWVQDVASRNRDLGGDVEVLRSLLASRASLGMELQSCAEVSRRLLATARVWNALARSPCPTMESWCGDIKFRLDDMGHGFISALGDCSRDIVLECIGGTAEEGLEPPVPILLKYNLRPPDYAIDLRGLPELSELLAEDPENRVMGVNGLRCSDFSNFFAANVALREGGPLEYVP